MSDQNSLVCVNFLPRGLFPLYKEDNDKKHSGTVAHYLGDLYSENFLRVLCIIALPNPILNKLLSNC